VDAISQVGSAQTQSLAALFSSSTGSGAKDITAFGKELTKQIDGSISQVQSNSARPQGKAKKDEETLKLTASVSGDLPAVIIPVLPLNLTQTSPLTVLPVFSEGAVAVIESDNASSAAPAVTQGVVTVGKDFEGKDVCEVSDLPKTGSMERTQVTDPRVGDSKEDTQINAVRDDRRYSVKPVGDGSDSANANLHVKTISCEPARDGSPIATCGGASPHPQQNPSAGPHDNKNEMSTADHRQSPSVITQAAAVVADQPQPLAATAAVQLMQSFPAVMDSEAVDEAPEAGKECAPKAGIPALSKGVVAKSTLPLEGEKVVKAAKGEAADGRRGVLSDGNARVQAGTERGQSEAATIKVNAEKTPDVIPSVHSTTGTSSAMGDTEQSTVRQPHQAGQASAPEIAAPVSNPSDVVHAVRMFERDGQAEMHIGVHSDALGTIDVKTTIREGSVGVSIGVERHEVRSALASELPGLETTLRDHALRLGEVRFHDTGSTLASGYGNGRQHQSQDFSRPPVPLFYRAAKSSSESNELPVEMITTIARAGISVHV
jgi:flagellar hook-length control protein FliK